MEEMAAIITVIFIVVFAALRAGKKSGTPENNRLFIPNDVSRWIPQVQRAFDRYGLPYEIGMGQLWQESYPPGNPDSIGGAGEIGLFQLKQIAVDDLVQNGYNQRLFKDWKSNPQHNIEAGAAFLDLQKKRAGSIRGALGAYNQGYFGSITNNQSLAKAYAEKVISKAKLFGFNG